MVLLAARLARGWARAKVGAAGALAALASTEPVVAAGVAAPAWFGCLGLGQVACAGAADVRRIDLAHDGGSGSVSAGSACGALSQ